MFGRGNLLWTFFPPLVVVLVTTLALVTGFSGRAIRGFFLEQTAEELHQLADVTSGTFTAPLAAGRYDQVHELCADFAARSGKRFTIIVSGGKVIADSDEDPDLMDNHGNRPEIEAAFAGRVGRSTRYSATLGHQRMYVAVGRPPGQPAFVVRTSLSLASLDGLMSDVYRKIALTGLILMVLSALTSFLLARKLSRGLGELQRGAEAFAAGNLEGRLTAGETTEIAAVAEAMNRMAAQLADRFGTIVRQRNESDAVLTSMVEGVLAVDTEENVIGLNAAGGRMLGQAPDRAQGRSVQEVGRNTGLTRLVQDVLAGDSPLERDIMLTGAADTWVQVHATALAGPGSEPIGVLLVMNDVTRVRRLEDMRRDFVANVSHELKTPITSIKGFVETILETPPADPREMERFLGIINNQADRLDAIITDLLALSRLEKDTDNGGIETHPLPLAPVLERVVRDAHNLRPDQASRITLDVSGAPRAAINAPLLEQAVGNLLGNALKYSGDEGPVHVACRAEGDGVLISVTDRGPGIAPEHLPRIFERFYRVDKARSRRMGGTGLGLAIVKHICQAHRGRVEVESRVGDGSTFTIHLPPEG